MFGVVSALLAGRTRCQIGYENLPEFDNKVKFGYKVEIGKKVWFSEMSMEVVTVYGHIPKYHVTFGSGRLNIIWWDPPVDHSTSKRRFENVPWYIPVRKKYVKIVINVSLCEVELRC